MQLPQFDRFPGVTRLELGAPLTMDVTRLSTLPTLKELDIFSCRAMDLTPLTELDGLRSLS
ncbi:hypothetical protein ABH935_004636 [Catenulispora sp. GAS73]|uniref:hypothetical protein n=1 Tax=Catenulispora sp. GAS73 TaxID=3156269 RepID=UPI00351813EC